MTDGLTLRPAGPGDGEMLWHWRNDPEVRQASLSTDEIPLADHIRWYERALANEDREILIAERGGAPIGMVRFDREGDIATVSILLDHQHRGQGLAGDVLSQAIESSKYGENRLRAMVKADNAASLALFRSVGFTIVRDDDPVVLEKAGASE